MAIDSYSLQLIASLLDGTSTALNPGAAASTGSILEATGGTPYRITGLATDVNIKLGTLTNPLFLVVWGDTGISVKIANGGTAMAASPFFAVCNQDTGLGISEIWVSNSEAAEKTYILLAGE